MLLTGQLFQYYSDVKIPSGETFFK